jgi:SAM-dependent methyltransferase
MPSEGERKDLVEFAHDAPARIVCCAFCGLLVRDERRDPSEPYKEDSYDFAATDAILPRYVEAFRAKREPYRAMLPVGAKVLEVGPHLGAFLDVAAEWGWQAEGVDIGKDTSAYLVARGHRIQTRPLEECALGESSFDGVFIWNCFDQIDNPHETLAVARRITKPGGLLVLRTPNGRFYEACEATLRDATCSPIADSVTAALGYDNLLAFPYLFGYDNKTLARVAAEHGYEHVQTIDSELIILPFPELPLWMVAERRAVATALRMAGPVRQLESQGFAAGPWIEALFRAR